MGLTKRGLKRADLKTPAIVTFNCGSLPRDEDITNFLRGEETIDRVEGGELCVWLYHNANGELVGVSSLGKTEWRYPKQNGSKIPIQIIPNLAVATVHQGNKYSWEILDATIAEAIDRKEQVSDILGLFVHVENAVARRLYEGRAFESYAAPITIEGEQYQRMLLRLPQSLASR